MKLFRSTYFDYSVHRRSGCDSGNSAGHVVRRHRLNEHRWHMYLVVNCGEVRELLGEFEKLRGSKDRIRNWRGLDQIFLCDFGPEESAFQQTFRSHDRECHVMSYPCSLLVRKKVAG